MGALGLIIKPHLSCAQAKDNFRASDVVQCFDENATTGSSINESVVQVMMDESIKELTGITNVGEAWKSIFPGITEDSIISIKVNPINSSLPTHLELINCIVNGLVRMEFGGLEYIKNNIIIWDRSDGDLTASGYTIYDGNDPDTVRCFGTNHSGVGYDYATSFDVNGVTSHPSRILSEMSDYLIDAAVLKNLSLSGVTMNLKNHYGSINNPSSLHGNMCNPYIPSLNQQIRDVLVPNDIQKVFIIDALFARYVGDGSANFNPKMLIISQDIVACDYQGQNVINEERANQGYSPIDAEHITTAAQPPYNLGTTDINLIEIENPTRIKESDIINPKGSSLGVAPNPFHGKTKLTLSLKRNSAVYLDLVNASGRVLKKIHSGQFAKGTHQMYCHLGSDIPAGAYFIRLLACGESQVKKVMLMR